MGSATHHQGLSGWQLRGHTHKLHRVDQGCSRKAWKWREEISTDGGCTEDPKLQLLPPLATSEQFQQLCQMQGFLLQFYAFPLPLQGCASSVSLWCFMLSYGSYSGTHIIPPPPRDHVRHHQLQKREGEPPHCSELPHSSRWGWRNEAVEIDHWHPEIGMSADWSKETPKLEWFHTGNGSKFLYKKEKFGRETKAV